MIPLEYFILRKCLVPHHFLCFCTCLVVDKIADEHINSLRTCHQFFQSFDNIRINIHIYPVIAVHHFIVYSGCVTQSGIDCLSMSAVLLMDRPLRSPDNFFILICNLCGIVFLWNRHPQLKSPHLLRPKAENQYIFSYRLQNYNRGIAIDNIFTFFPPYVSVLFFVIFFLSESDLKIGCKLKKAAGIGYSSSVLFGSIKAYLFQNSFPVLPPGPHILSYAIQYD